MKKQKEIHLRIIKRLTCKRGYFKLEIKRKFLLLFNIWEDIYISKLRGEIYYGNSNWKTYEEVVEQFGDLQNLYPEDNFIIIKVKTILDLKLNP